MVAIKRKQVTGNQMGKVMIKGVIQLSLGDLVVAFTTIGASGWSSKVGKSTGLVVLGKRPGLGEVLGTTGRGMKPGI
jgi:hypothetical protein